MRRAQEVQARERYAWQKWWMLCASRRAAFVKVGKRNRSKLSGRAPRVICKKAGYRTGTWIGLQERAGKLHNYCGRSLRFMNPSGIFAQLDWISECDESKRAKTRTLGAASKAECKSSCRRESAMARAQGGSRFHLINNSANQQHKLLKLHFTHIPVHPLSCLQGGKIYSSSAARTFANHIIARVLPAQPNLPSDTLCI